jgi:hypothetical protein
MDTLQEQLKLGFNNILEDERNGSYSGIFSYQLKTDTEIKSSLLKEELEINLVRIIADNYDLLDDPRFFVSITGFDNQLKQSKFFFIQKRILTFTTEDDYVYEMKYKGKNNFIEKEHLIVKVSKGDEILYGIFFKE